MQLEPSGPAIFGVTGHQQALQLLVYVGDVLVDLCKAVVDVAADLRGQGSEQMVVFRGRLGYVADSEFAFHLAKPGVWVVTPEVGDLE